jgi:hypothetical protein
LSAGTRRQAQEGESNPEGKVSCIHRRTVEMIAHHR